MLFRSLVGEVRDAEFYSVSFFDRTFNLTKKILNNLHELENDQISMFRRQMEEHQALIDATPSAAAHPQPIVVKTIEDEIKPAENGREGVTMTETIVPEPPVVQSPEPVSVSGEKHPRLLHEVLEKQNLADLRKAFSLNDRFYFRKELFAGDEAKMSKVISDLNDVWSYEGSIAYVNEKLNWDIEDPIVAEFVQLLEKRFL